MVLFAKGAPDTKTREMDGQMPFEEWIYGKPPEEVDFVRINGNRVIRVEIAKDGRAPPDLHQGCGLGHDAHRRHAGMTAATTPAPSKEGDVERDPNKQAPAAPPSLRKPGEKLPSDSTATHGSSGV